MTLKDFYENAEKNIFETIQEYEVKTDSKTKQKYIISPIQSREDIEEYIESEVSSPEEDIDNFDQEEDEELLTELKDKMLKYYDTVLFKRKRFREEFCNDKEFEEDYE